MEINFILIACILTTHYMADFVFQSHSMAINKSKSLEWLSYHCLVYTGILLVVTHVNPIYAIVNGILHFIVDFFTSKWSSRLYAIGDYHNFFCVIGFDQLVHTLTLLGTFVIFFN